MIVCFGFFGYFCCNSCGLSFCPTLPYASGNNDVLFLFYKNSSFNLLSALGLTASTFGIAYVILNNFPPKGLPPFFFNYFAFFLVSYSSSYIAKSSYISRPVNIEVRSASVTSI